jgi:Arm DNA-binding domain
MGLGPVNIISLAEARKRVAECRKLRFDGIDPIEARKAQRDNAKHADLRAETVLGPLHDFRLAKDTPRRQPRRRHGSMDAVPQSILDQIFGTRTDHGC